MLLDEICSSTRDGIQVMGSSAGRLEVKVLLPVWAPPSPFTVAIGAPPPGC